MTRAAALIFIFMVTAVQAQPIPTVCQPHGSVKEKLEREYGEVLVAMGLAGSALFEVYASAKGTFTVMLTRPDMNGLSCVQGAGTDFTFTGNAFPDTERERPS